MPSNFSEPLKELVKHILVVEPSKRFDVEDIRRHPWYNIVLPNEKNGYILGKDDIPLDDKILDKVEKDYKHNVDKVKLDLKRNKFNSATTTYYLLLKRSERSGMYKK